MYKAVLLVCFSILGLASAFYCRYPHWPSEFRWSYAGPINGWTCIQIREPSDPNTWKDNYFCHASAPGIQGVGMRWSYSGPIKNMKCTQITEPAEPTKHHWKDNFLCVPKNSPFNFNWSYAGPKKCIQWLEPADPHTWKDNYLCH